MRSPKRHRIPKEDCREFAESIENRTNSCGGRSKELMANPSRHLTKLIGSSFNRQFTTSKLGKHSSSRRTRHVSKDVKWMSLEEAKSFTSDQVTSAIKSYRRSRAYGPDSLLLKNLGPLATEHLTTLYNDSLKSCCLPSICKTSLVIPIPKVSSQGTSYRPISLLCAAAKVNEALFLPSINEFISPAKDQHGF